MIYLRELLYFAGYKFLTYKSKYDKNFNGGQISFLRGQKRTEAEYTVFKRIVK